MHTMIVAHEEAPSHGHMLVVADCGHQAGWLPDRRSTLDRPGNAARVILTGSDRRMMVTHADPWGRINLSSAFCYADGRDLTPGTHEADAYAVLTDPRAVAEVLYPPYVGDVMQRPSAEHLAEPDVCLLAGDTFVVHRRRRAIVWINAMGGHGSRTACSFTAPLLPSGAVAWEAGAQIDKLPHPYQRDLWPLADSLWAEAEQDDYF
ncbi:hypothetical protein [Nonomuraea sp. NPDC049695]|uniref:hypothetical protein n=1 Tax=Nonomuraea sp. NPDC049695 TaxID=3154734 RepID=UPI003446B1B6